MYLIKGAILIMKGVRKNGIYSLINNIVIRDVSMVQDEFVYKAGLWHMRLGHVNERGSQELSKQRLLYGDKIGILGFFQECVFVKSKRSNLRLVFIKLRES